MAPGPAVREAHIWPARHDASDLTGMSYPPMGQRFRLKANVPITGYPAPIQVIFTAFKRYGLILADNGSAIFISGAPDNRWNNSDLNQLKTITASSFEVVQMGTIYTDSNVPTGPSPTISSFTANATSVTSGTPVTLSWSVVAVFVIIFALVRK